MEKPIRKPNRLVGFDYGQEGCYFVTLCVFERQRLFSMGSTVGNGPCAVPDTGDERPSNQIIRKWICQTQDKFENVRIDKYVIMPDHLHMIVTIREQHMGRSLPDIMHFFKTMTTNAYIRGVKSGMLPPFQKKLWQKSYYEHVIRNQQDYNEVWEYIENNPLKWILTHEG